MGSYREQQEATTANYGPTQTSGVHQSPTSPAPYLEELPDDAMVGSIPMEALTCFFQPVVSLRNGKTFGFEAIAHCTAEGLTDREELFARAAFEKRVGELGRAVRAIAFTECPSIPLFVSVHPHELKESWLIRPDDPICGHDAEVFLQVAQGAYSPMCLHVLSEVSSRTGIALLLDELGGPGSNLRQLVELAPAFVKLDAELVVAIDRNPRKRAAALGLVRMCGDLGAQVIAKGISTEAELRTLLECGVTFGQGDLLGAARELPTVSSWRGYR
jgi:EAL domain-containing protein (putative c-di-GMP-specific phosphodiesterase class I)